MKHDLVAIKAKVSLAFLWRHYQLPGELIDGKSALCPFHKEKTPSFGTFAGGQKFKCMGCQAGGDIFDFVARKENINAAKAIEICASLAGAEQKPAVAVKTEEKFIPAMGVGIPLQWKMLAEIRGLKESTIQLAVKKGFIRFGRYRDVMCWFLTDSSTRVIQARRLDGGKFGDIKAVTMKGHEASWPVGIPESNPDRPIDLVEGGPDFLAALELGLNPVAMLGAANRVHHDAEAMFKGRGVRIYAHHDEAGEMARVRWTEQLTKLGCAVGPVTWTGDAKDLNDMIKSGGKLQAVSEPASAGASEKPKPVVVTDPDALPFRILGHDRGQYFYLPSDQSQVVVLEPSSHTKPNLLQLARLDWWISKFPGGSGSFTVDTAQDWLMSEARKQGVFKRDRIRGRGCWREGQKIVWHNGDELLVDCKVVGIHEHSFRNVYEVDDPLDTLNSGCLTDKDAAELVRLVRMLRWKSQVEAELFLGWLACSVVGGALNWRPHLWLTAQRGAGKSWTMKEIVRELLGRCVVFAQSSTSEAGIRQTIGHDSFGVIFDESETDGAKSATRFGAVTDLARASSTDGDAALIKGSATGQAVSFIPRSCFLFSSIGVGITNAADYSRITVVELVPGGTEDEFQKLCDFKFSAIKETTGSQFRRRCINRCKQIRENARVFSAALAGRLGDKRNADQMGTLLAGRFSFEAVPEGYVMTLEDAKVWLAQFAVEGISEDGRDVNDEKKCLAHLLNSRLDMDGGKKRTVGELVGIVIREGEIQEEMPFNQEASDARVALVSEITVSRATLNRSGIEVANGSLIVADCHPLLAGIYKDTSWAGKHARYLRRLPDSGVRTTHRFVTGASPDHCTKIPLKGVLK